MDGASFPAFGGIAVVHVTDADALGRARAAVEQVIEAFDAACSRFRDDSELTRVNRCAGTAVGVSELFAEALEAALRAAQLTDGAVDPTVGRALVALGYDRDFDSMAAFDTPVRMRVEAVPGWRTIAYDRGHRSVRIPPGVALDFGATAKALAADHAAAAAASAAGCGVLVGLSGDFALAGTPPADGWAVRITDDHRAALDAPGQWITLRTGGLATSSTTVRRWGGDRHHLIDPATGAPVRTVWRTASVTAVSCLDANIASTAAIVRPDGAAEWLGRLGLPSRLVAVDGGVRHVARWPEAGEELPLLEAVAS